MKFIPTIICLLAAGSVASGETDNPAQTGNEAFARKQYSLAVESYSEALKNQQSAALHLNLGHAYIQLAQWPAAIKSYESALALKDPEIPPAEIRGYLGQAEYFSGNHTRALHFLMRAKQGKPPGAHSLMIGRCLVDLQRYAPAESEILEFIKVNPGDVQGQDLLAHIYLQTAQTARAVEVYERLLKQSPLEVHRYQILAQTQVADGNYSQAIDTLESARLIFGSSESELDQLLADLYIQEAMYREAAACYARITRNGVKPNAEDLYRLGYCYYQSRQWLSARQAFTKVIQLDPAHARSVLHLGHIAARKGEIKSAMEAYAKSAQLDKEWAEPYFSLAELQTKQKHFQPAAESFRKAHRRHEFDAKDYYNYLLILQQVRDNDQFISILTRAISKYPRDNRLNQLMDRLGEKPINP